MNTNNLALSGKYPPLELKLTSQGCCGKEVGWNCGCALVRSMDTRVRMWRQCTRGLPVSIIFTKQQIHLSYYSMFNALCKQTYPTPLKDWSWILTNGLQWLRRISFMLEWQLLWNENSSSPFERVARSIYISMDITLFYSSSWNYWLELETNLHEVWSCTMYNHEESHQSLMIFATRGLNLRLHFVG